MSGIVGSRLNSLGSGPVGKLGSDGQLLTSAGAGKSIVFEAAPAAGGDIGFGGDTFGEAKVIGSNDNYSLSLETAGNTAMTVDESGATTKPLQPAFLAVPAAAQDNLTEGSQNTIVLGTEVFDIGGDFTSNTFTAPVTGKYYFNVRITIAQLDHDAAYYSVGRLITSNNEQYTGYAVRDFCDEEPEAFSYVVDATVDMDASDTAYAAWVISGSGASQEDVYDSGNVEFTSFGGVLLT